MDANLYDAFAARFPRDRAARFIETPEGRLYSYADLEATSGRYAALLLDRGVQVGDRVAVQTDKSPEAIFLYLACLRAGAIYLPMNPAYRASEVAYFLADASPRVFVCRPEDEAGHRPLAKEAGVAHLLTLGVARDGTFHDAAAGLPGTVPTAASRGGDIAAILYSSGTTGRPKGAMMSHANLGSNAETLRRAWGFRPDDVLLHALPIFHTHGLFVATNCVLLSGSGMIFLAKFDAAQVASLLPRATVFMAIPTFYVRLLGLPAFDAAACEGIRLFTSGSAPLLTETFEAFTARSGHTILERYGMTETGMLTSNPLDGERRGGTVGFPLPDVSLRIGAPDEDSAIGGIEVKGPNVFKGYWMMPEKTASEFTADGYFKTGDLGVVDPDGYVSIVGRSKDLIISGGFNVYPTEVETCLDEIDGVDETAVIGIPHPDFGEAVTAIVKPKPGRTLSAEALIMAAKEGLANYKVPKRVFFVEDLPRNAMGKVQKAMLRTQFDWAADLRAPAARPDRTAP